MSESEWAQKPVAATPVETAPPDIDIMVKQEVSLPSIHLILYFSFINTYCWRYFGALSAFADSLI